MNPKLQPVHQDNSSVTSKNQYFQHACNFSISNPVGNLLVTEMINQITYVFSTCFGVYILELGCNKFQLQLLGCKHLYIYIYI